MRASGSDRVRRGLRPDNRSSTGNASVHHAASAGSGAPDSAMAGIFPIRPTAAVRPGCSAMPCAISVPRCSSAVTIASVRPMPVPPIVTSRSQPLVSSAFRDHIRLRATQSARRRLQHRPSGPISQISSPDAPDAAGILTMRKRGRRRLSCSSLAVRAIRRSSGPMRCPAAITLSRRDIAAGPAHALPRNSPPPAPCSNDPLSIDGIRGDDAIAISGIASPASTQAGAFVSGTGRIGGTPLPDRMNAEPNRPAIAMSRGGEAFSGGISAATSPKASASGNSIGATGARSSSKATSAASSGVSEAGRRWFEVMRDAGPNPARSATPYPGASENAARLLHETNLAEIAEHAGMDPREVGSRPQPYWPPSVSQACASFPLERPFRHHAASSPDDRRRPQARYREPG